MKVHKTTSKHTVRSGQCRLRPAWKQTRKNWIIQNHTNRISV